MFIWGLRWLRLENVDFDSLDKCLEMILRHDEKKAARGSVVVLRLIGYGEAQGVLAYMQFLGQASPQCLDSQSSYDTRRGGVGLCLVVIRFGHDWYETCAEMDKVLASVADKIQSFAVTYVVDISEVPDFNTMYEVYYPCTVMFFFRNKHMMVDLGTGRKQEQD
ncbi:hypothetical protein GIB67_035113 [Kingdonia uniflora]|uniref:Uncharacterized protein n=1 Tax=Kingdonia uniflora TaxID=39325 RepID=A0A7J7NVF4_9MAGN|nr:hypothetical protein GIB67_035113 [Kingdonia uniflora]